MQKKNYLKANLVINGFNTDVILTSANKKSIKIDNSSDEEKARKAYIDIINGRDAKGEKLELLMNLANISNNNEAQRYLGQLYIEGDGGIAQDISKGVELLTNSSNGDDIWSSLTLAYFYQSGDYLIRDEYKAQQLISQVNEYLCFDSDLKAEADIRIMELLLECVNNENYYYGDFLDEAEMVYDELEIEVE